MPDNAHLYLGRAGQLAVMSELLVRRLNVAIPEVDIGDDLFVVRAGDDTFRRIQVKSATGTKQRDGYFAQFHLSRQQLEEDANRASMVYIFAVRLENVWRDFIVISQESLIALHDEFEIGNPVGKDGLVIRLAFTAADIHCKGASLQLYRNAWEPWPPS